MNKSTENLTGIVRVDDIDAKTMKTLLKFIYQNKFTFEEATDLDVLMAANKYNIVDLVAKCEKYILMDLSKKNIMDILAISKFLPTTNKIFEKAMNFYHQMEDTKNVFQGKIWTVQATKGSVGVPVIYRYRFTGKWQNFHYRFTGKWKSIYRFFRGENGSFYS
jgi:hypothetical protein